MTLETLRIDGDDIDDLLRDIQRSFGIQFPHDLMHVNTVGDLHQAILREAGESAGTFCGTSWVFY